MRLINRIFAVPALAGIAVAFFSASPSAEAELTEATSIQTLTGALPAEEGPGENNSVPEGLTTSDWGQIRQEYERHRHSAVPNGDGYKARNHRQQWLIRFDGRGFSVEPDQGGWNWGLELVSYGLEGTERMVEGKATISTDKNRVAYAWDETVEEWLVNDARGLKHGFTFNERPAGEGGRLQVRLGVRGGLSAEVVNSRAVRFVDEDAAEVVSYAGLKVWDADGRSLPARLDATPTGQVRIVVDDRAAKYPVTVDPLAQQSYLKASNTGMDDEFGWAVAVSGDTVVVGAHFEDSNGVGVNPASQADNSATDSGAAYVFVRTEGVWSQQAYLKASNTDAGDEFGRSVAVSGDTVVVGADLEDGNGVGVNPASQANNSVDDSGAAYIFVRTEGVWSQQAYLKASNPDMQDFFGASVAVSGDTVVVGADFESSNGVGVNPASQADNSADASGAAYVFVRAVGVWSQQAYLKASNTDANDVFGRAVAVSGDTVVVGAWGESSNGVGVNSASQADNSADAAGAAYVFVRAAGVWSQQAYLKASNTDTFDSFGITVAVSGDTVVVGAVYEASNGTGVNPATQGDNSATDSGAAYVFVRAAGVWSQQAYLKASNAESFDEFGTSVAVSGDTVVVGAWGESSNGTGVNPDSQADNSADAAGAAYVFARTEGVWSQEAYLKASNAGEFDEFGFAVAASGDTVVVGARFESSNGVGVDPDSQGDNSADASGAAYVFTDVAVVADAGPDQLIHVPAGGTAQVTLDGSGSIHSEGHPLIYTWTVPFPEGDQTVMGEMPMVMLPPGVYTITLTVDDGGGLMNTDTVEITVNQIPTADAGPDQWHQVPGGGTANVMLDGSGSSDLDMDVLSFTWTGPFPEGSGTVMGVTPMVTLPEGTHNITLAVDDGNGGMDSDTVEIQVSQAGACPSDLVIENVLLAGSQTLEATASITLGPNVIVNGTNIVVNAPVVTINSDTEIGGTFSIGTTPSCP